MTADAAGVARAADGAEVFHELEQDGFEEVPVFGAAGEEAGEPEVVLFDFVNVDDGEIALTGGGNIKAQAVLGL